MTTMNSKVAVVAALLLSTLGPAILSGCHTDAPVGDARVEKMAADANAIAVRSGGDWDKLTPDEKTAMLNIQHGNEAGAKNLLHALSGQTYEGRWGKPGDGKTKPPAFASSPGSGQGRGQ